MNEQDLITQLKQASEIKAPHELHDRIEAQIRQPRSPWLLRYRPLVVLASCLVLVFWYSTTTQSEAMPVEFIIEQRPFVPTPDYNNLPETKDVWQDSPLPEAMLKNQLPFKILYPEYLPEGYTLQETLLTETKSSGQGITLRYSLPGYVNVLTLTEFIGDKKAIMYIQEDQSTLYQFGERQGVCYAIDESDGVYILEWSYGSYKLDLGGRFSCDELYKIAVSVR